MIRLFRAIINFFRGLFGEAAKAIEDPVRDGKLAIEDSKDQIADFRMKIASLIAESKKMERRLSVAKEAVTKWTGIAEMAAGKGDRDGAKSALEFKARASKDVATLSSEINRTNQTITNLKSQLDAAQNKITNAESNMTTLSARRDAAAIRKGLAEASAGLNSGDSPLAALDDLENQVNTSEAEAEALEEMSNTDTGADLESKYSGGSDMDSELEALMSKHTSTTE